MELIRTAKIKLDIPKNSIPVVDETLQAVLKALNYTSAVAFENNCLSSFKHLQKIVYRTLRNEYGLLSQMACNVCSVVAGTYVSAKGNNRLVLATYKTPKVLFSYNRDYSFTKDGLLSFSTLNGRLKIPYTVPECYKHYFTDDWKFGAMEIVKKGGEYFAHFSIKKEIDLIHPQQINNIIGIDSGMNFLATLYDSYGKVIFFGGRHLKNVRGNAKRLRKEVQSKGTRSAHIKLKKISGRENRLMTDVNHVISKQIVAHASQYKSLIVMEDLTGINLSAKVRHKDRYYRISWSFAQLQSFIEYKAQQKGLQVIHVDPKYTSQRCPRCGHTEKANRDKKNHIFSCKACQYTLNDDLIGAKNIWQKGLEHRMLLEEQIAAVSMTYTEGLPSASPM